MFCSVLSRAEGALAGSPLLVPPSGRASRVILVTSSRPRLAKSALRPIKGASARSLGFRSAGVDSFGGSGSASRWLEQAINPSMSPAARRERIACFKGYLFHSVANIGVGGFRSGTCASAKGSLRDVVRDVDLPAQLAVRVRLAVEVDVEQTLLVEVENLRLAVPARPAV